MDFAAQRHLMIEQQLRRRGISDQRVLQAMARVPRHLFIPPDLRDRAYEDGPLPIGENQTISQPYMVASMTQWLQLRGEERVLEIGTGSGYQAAVLSRLCREIFSVERHEALAERARRLLTDLEYDNVSICVGDGTLGWPDHGPYDAVIVTAGATTVPACLWQQTRPGARLVIPLESADSHMLYGMVREATGWERLPLERCTFVPLVGLSGGH